MTPTAAPVSSVHQLETLLYFTLFQLVVIVLMARLGGALALRMKQSRAVGEIIVGILLGPSLFGMLTPDAFSYVFRSVSPEPMTIMSQIGLILLMFQIGLEGCGSGVLAAIRAIVMRSLFRGADAAPTTVPRQHRRTAESRCRA